MLFSVFFDESDDSLVEAALADVEVGTFGDVDAVAVGDVIDGDAGDVIDIADDFGTNGTEAGFKVDLIIVVDDVVGDERLGIGIS